jgi:hypothetical protein
MGWVVSGAAARAYATSHFPRGCVTERGQIRLGCAEYTTHVQHTSDSRLGRLFCCICPVTRLIHHSPVSIRVLHPRNLNLNSSPITIYPPLDASLMQAIKDSNVGKHIARLLQMLCVKEGKEGQGE